MSAVAVTAFQAWHGDGHLPPEVMGQVTEARRAVYAAVASIEITGPEAVSATARTLLETGSQLLGTWGFERGASPQERSAVMALHETARSEFRRAARRALGFND